MWQAVVLTLKGGGYYCSIGLVYVVWKVVMVVLNCRFIAYTASNDVLHDFWAGLSTGNTSLEAKLPQQLMTMR